MSASAGYEQRDTRVRSVLLFGAALVVLVVAALLVVSALQGGMRRARARGDEPHPMSAYRAAPGEPLLQAVPAHELAAQRARERELLDTYGWVDRENRIARIPIERAMELLARRGLPARAEPEAGR